MKILTDVTQMLPAIGFGGRPDDRFNSLYDVLLGVINERLIGQR